MERAEKLGFADLTVESATVTNRLLKNELASEASPQAKSRVGFYVAGSLALQIAFVGVAATAGYRLVQKLGQVDSAVTAQTQDVRQLSNQVESLSAESANLKSEVVNLRNALASGSSEDVLFLKTVILKPDIDPDLARQVATDVHRYAALYGQDANLVLAIIAVESRFQPKVVSPVGAVGLMQVMPHWKKILGITGDLTDPETNIKYGLQVLGFYQQMYKDLDVVLTAYNRGPGPVDTALMHNRSPMNDYAPRVLQAYDRIKKLNVQSAGR